MPANSHIFLGPQFEEVHIEWPARLARLVKEHGRVERFIHLRCACAEG